MSKPANFAAPEDVEQAFYEAVQKGDADLLGKLDKALTDMKQDGTAAKIATQWFGKNIIK